MDDTIILRIFEYDAQIALNDGKRAGATFTVSFPHSAVMALRHTKKTPSSMHIRVVTPGGDAGYDVPVIKVQQYSLEEIFDRKLLFFLPIYIFSHEKQLPEYESDEAKLRNLTDEYRHILSKCPCWMIYHPAGAFHFTESNDTSRTISMKSSKSSSQNHGFLSNTMK